MTKSIGSARMHGPRMDAKQLIFQHRADSRTLELLELEDGRFHIHRDGVPDQKSWPPSQLEQAVKAFRAACSPLPTSRAEVANRSADQ